VPFANSSIKLFDGINLTTENQNETPLTLKEPHQAWGFFVCGIRVKVIIMTNDQGFLKSSGGGIQTYDLRVMSPKWGLILLNLQDNVTKS